MRYIGVGRRFVAWAVDLLLIGGIIALLGDYRDGPGYEVSWLGWRFVVAFLLVPVAYLVLFEWLVSATPGKFLVGIRVRTEAGARIGFGSSLVRNLARLVDALPYVVPYIVGAVAISRSPSHQRLGDRWAGTVVIGWGSEAAADVASSPTPGPSAITSGGLPAAPDGEPQAQQPADGSFPPSPPLPPPPTA